jgi:hypothetical protein
MMKSGADLPKFLIDVYNDGPEATVIVSEYLNENEPPSEVLNQKMAHGETAKDVECEGTPPKKFKWENRGSANTGTATKGDGGRLEVDPQGRKNL